MSTAYLLVAAVHQSRKARLALARGNNAAALALIANSFRHVGKASARRPAYLSRAGHARRVALVESIALATSKMLAG